MVLFVILLLALRIQSNVASNDKKVIESCCLQGKSFLEGDCGEFPVPIANISQEYQNLCIATMEICCISARREAACERGHQKAKEGLTCQSNEEPSSLQPCSYCEYEKASTECCIACKMGSLTPPQDCSRMVNLLPSHYSQNSFIKCCTGDDPTSDGPDQSNEEKDRCPMGYAFNDLLQGH